MNCGISCLFALCNDIEFFQEIKQKFVDTDFSLPGKEEITESGLRMIIHKEGNGQIPILGQTVKVHYTGMLLDGTKFDSSLDRGVPFEFTLGQGQVIRGWDEGIGYFNKGAKGTIYIPSTLGYGPNGAGGSIPPNSILIFDIELLDF